ncbi:hypothetical protein A2V82_09045 [candidate division KSB1 bacterium RBG_16_48_16]|nr:MAG: hypothetical protein A2V82_09045 [candidate division KSB1 bacterium RBG_16_48_16]
MKILKNTSWLFLLLTLIVMSGVQNAHAQAIGASGELKWLRVSSLHTYFSEQGSESETGGTERRNVTVNWPGEYGISQSTMRAKGMFLGSKDYYDAKIDRTFPYYVVNAGPKPNEYPQRPVFDAVEFKLVGKLDHPLVSVDDELATINTLYDVLDDLDENLIADRMILVTNHSAMGATVTKKVYAFTQQYHNNYYVYDYVIKNTGIIDNEGTVNQQTLKDFWFCLSYRYALSGESVRDDAGGNRLGWGIDNSSWGRNVVNDVVGTNPSAPDFNDPNSLLYMLRANFAWYGPHSQRPLNIEDDWGCPNQDEDGLMAAAKFVGHTVLHADKSSQDPSDDLTQPRTTQYIDTDSDVAQRASSQYDEPLMARRYQMMSQGHAAKSQAQEIAESGTPANEWGPGIGGTTSVQGFGPYTLEPGDSIHIIIAGGVAGLSREKNREVGGSWLRYYNGTGTPELIMPDGSRTTDHTAYKKAWVLTCKDSMLQTFQRIHRNYNSDYITPQPPDPPNTFTVHSGGDRIRLSWADNAVDDPGFDGYVIYRSESTVIDPLTVYKKIFECDQSNVVHAWDDTTAARGFNYYYYIQSKDDGSTNDIKPGTPLLSSLFWTLTSVPAFLRRPAVEDSLEAIRVVPNPYDIRSRVFQFGEKSHYDRIAFYGLPPECTVKIFTERGDLIWEKVHDDGSGDELWDSLTSSGQIVVSGIYIAYFETPTGEAVYRKFVIIR